MIAGSNQALAKKNGTDDECSVAASPPAARIEVSYSVGGYMQGGFDKMAPAVNGVLGEQLSRLKSLIDTGKPVAPK